MKYKEQVYSVLADASLCVVRVCMCTHVYINVRVCICVYTCAYVYVYKCVKRSNWIYSCAPSSPMHPAYIFYTIMCVCVFIIVCICVFVIVYIHKWCVWARKYIHVHIRKCMNVYIHHFKYSCVWAYIMCILCTRTFTPTHILTERTQHVRGLKRSRGAGGARWHSHFLERHQKTCEYARVRVSEGVEERVSEWVMMEQSVCAFVTENVPSTGLWVCVWKSRGISRNKMQTIAHTTTSLSAISRPFTHTSESNIMHISMWSESYHVSMSHDTHMNESALQNVLSP